MSDSNDAGLLLKKRARRRLVGAVAFALLAIILLPMVMDDEKPQPRASSVQIVIPNEDQPPLSEKVPEPPETASSAEEADSHTLAQSVQKTKDPNVIVIPGDHVAAPIAVDAENKTAGKPVNTNPAEIVVPEEKVVSKTTNAPQVHREPELSVHEAAKAKTKKAPESADKKVEKEKESSPSQGLTEAQRAAAILNGEIPDVPRKTENSKAHKKNAQEEKYVVMAGAFSNAANANQVKAKIQSIGLNVFTESVTISGKAQTRVRVGPFSGRTAAEQAVTKLKTIGVNGVVTSQ